MTMKRNEQSPLDTIDQSTHTRLDSDTAQADPTHAQTDEEGVAFLLPHLLRLRPPLRVPLLVSGRDEGTRLRGRSVADAVKKLTFGNRE